MGKSVRIVFAGTPAFALPALNALAASPHAPAAVYTQPDRRAGRGRTLRASPVKKRAVELGLPVEQPASFDSGHALRRLADYRPGLLVVVAYGLYLPENVLSVPDHGCWNLHPSLLPRWRGAAPIQRALLAGDARTGVCLMQMAARLDAGPILSCRSLAITAADTAGDLHDRLAADGAALLLEALDGLERGKPPAAHAQDDSRASYAPKINTAEAELDWREPAGDLARKIRAFNPVPGARASLRGETVKLWRARAASGAGAPGAVLKADASGLKIGTGHGVLEVFELQRPGKRRVSAGEYGNALAAMDQASRAT